MGVAVRWSRMLSIVACCCREFDFNLSRDTALRATTRGITQTKISVDRLTGLTSGWGSSGIMVHGCIEAEFRAVVDVVVVGAVKPWQKAAAVAATQRDSESLMVAVCIEKKYVTQ